MPDNNTTEKENQKKLTKMLSELEEINQYFDSEEFDIDTGIKKYEQGVKLTQEIKKILTSYELKLKEIRENNS